MMHPILLTRPLLVHALAAVLLCPVAFAKTKSLPQKQTPQVKQTQAAKQTQAVKKSSQVKKPAVAPAAPVPAVKKPAAAPAGRIARQTQGDAPRQSPKLDHRSLIVDPADLLARVPASGRLNEEHLIVLAIAKDPKLAGLRAAIAMAVADRRKQQDWENPELRLSYGSQDDDFVRNPFTERTIENFSSTEDFTSSDTTTSLAALGELGYGEVTSDSVTDGTESVTRYREIERIVTPRRDGGEDVTTNIYDRRITDSTGIRDREFTDGIITQNRRDALAENVERTLRSTATERTTGPGTGNGQESFSAVLRFQMPHPWQKKARVQRASAEIMLAEAKYLAEEDKLVRDVRDLFQTLQVLESTDSAQQKRRQNFTSLLSEMEGAGVAEFAAEGLRARLEMNRVYDDMREVTSDIDRIRAELALLCGLPRTERIRTGGLISRRVIDLATLDPGYLVEMAMLYRADVVESRGRLEIAKAYLAEANAAKIPWATFIDAGWSRQWREGHSGNEDEWMVRLGIEIPLFEWTGINKRGREYKKAAAKWELQFELQRDRVSAEVDLALERLRKSATSLRTYESNIRREQLGITESLKLVEAGGTNESDYAKAKRFKYDIEDLTQRREIQRYKAFDDYNKSLRALENAIGVRVEKVLNGWRDK